MSTQPTVELLRATVSRVLITNGGRNRDAFVSSLSDIIVLRVEAHGSTKIYLMITEQGSNQCRLLDAWEYILYPGWPLDNALVAWDCELQRFKIFIIFPTAQAADEFGLALRTIMYNWMDELDDEMLEKLLDELDESMDSD